MGINAPQRCGRGRYALAWSAIPIFVGAPGAAHARPADGDPAPAALRARAIGDHADVRAERWVRLADSRAVVGWWTERSASGETRRYAVSRDGQHPDRVRAADDTLNLSYARFDPLAGEPPVPAAFRAADTSLLRIVQFRTPPLDEYRRDLAAAGAELCAALPGHACIVRAAGPAGARVAALPYVRWVGAFHPAYRAGRGVMVAAAGGGGPVRVSIMVFERGPGQQAVVADAVRALGGVVHQVRPMGFRLDATVPPAGLARVLAMDEVMYVDLWAPPGQDMDLARAIGGANTLESVAGFTGQGVRGEVTDAGMRTTHAAFAARPVIMHTENTVSTVHGTSCYGILFGDGTAQSAGRGLLPDAQGIFTSFVRMPDRYVNAAELVDPAGPYRAVFQSSSWGGLQTQDYTTVSSEMDDILFLTDLLACQSQSNMGTRDSRPEAWAKNVVSVGGLSHYDTLARKDDQWTTASIGPAADGRVKPDLAHFYDKTLCPTDGSDTAYRPDFGGTSGATPIVAGHFGLFFQMWSVGVFGNPVSGMGVFEERPHAATAKALLINSAYRYPFSGRSANLSRDKQGWGMPDLTRLYGERARYLIVDEGEPLRPFDVRTYVLAVPTGDRQLRVTMVYRDPRGVPAAGVARINDLSLRVTSPGGAVYWGNSGLEGGNFSDAAAGPNEVDTVENVFLDRPAAGEWRIEVLGDEIAEDAWPETSEVDAAFALVAVAGAPLCAGDFDRSGVLNVNDYVSLHGAWSRRDPLADFDGDGVFSVKDFIGFESAFAKGCP